MIEKSKNSIDSLIDEFKFKKYYSTKTYLDY